MKRTLVLAALVIAVAAVYLSRTTPTGAQAPATPYPDTLALSALDVAAKRAELETQEANLKRQSVAATSEAERIAQVAAQTQVGLGVQQTQVALFATQSAVDLAVRSANDNATRQAVVAVTQAAKQSAIDQIEIDAAQEQAKIDTERKRADSEWKIMTGRVFDLAFVVLVAGGVVAVLWYLKELADRWSTLRETPSGNYALIEGNWRLLNEPQTAYIEEPQTAPPAPVKPSEQEQERAIRVHRWRIAAHRLVVAGAKNGFSIRSLGPSGAGIVSDDGWRKLTDLLKDATVLCKDGQGARWADGWDLERWQREGKMLDFHYPPDSATPSLPAIPPDVSL